MSSNVLQSVATLQEDALALFQNRNCFVQTANTKFVDFEKTVGNLGMEINLASRYAHKKFWPSCPQNLFASRDLS